MSYNLGKAKHVFLDWHFIEPGYGVAWGGEKPTSWEMPSGIRLTVHPPTISSAPIVIADRPWESFINVYATLLSENGLHRLYYESHYHAPNGEEHNDLKGVLAYAESRDGVDWIKPKIGGVSFQGSTDTNLIFGGDVSLGRGGHGAGVFKDPSAPPEERYKLVHMAHVDGKQCVCGAVSEDGLHWKALEKPLITGYMSDTQTIIAFDEQKGCYVGYFRGWIGYERGKYHGRRTIAYAESDTFETWPIPETIVAPDVHDNPDTDIYTNAYTRWPGTVDAHLMFPAMYERSADVLEVHMFTSRDGLHWQRPLRKPIVGRGAASSGWEGGVYAGCGLITMPTGEWALPISPKWHTHNELHFRQAYPEDPPDRGHIRLALWRPDGFTSLDAPVEGRCTTIPFTFSGSQLKVNACTQFGGDIAFELVKADGEQIPGFTFDECDALSGDGPQHIVAWNGKSDVSAWIGQEMRLRLRMRRASLYALQFI